MNKRKILLASAALAMMLTLSACGGGNKAANNANNGATTDAGSNAAAEAIYKQNCVICHGADLKGQNLNTVGSRWTREQIVTQITDGGGGMPAFKGKLSDDQVNTLADWLVTMK